MTTEMTLRPIGTVRREGTTPHIHVQGPFRPGLEQLSLFSHAIVVWWADQHDNPESRAILQTELPYAPGVTAGVFACRSEYRPNPIAITVCELGELDVGSGTVEVVDIDAYEGTPVLDIKPYIGVVDRVAKIEVPNWYEGWPEWLPDTGIGLFEE
jgi:tRNA-Thr(GGU) m(6)t(6)A37 methyltransferase TsaA